MSSNPINTSNVSNAWRYQREHQPATAVTEFEKILKQDANNIDALFGLGLAPIRPVKKSLSSMIVH